MFLSNLHNFYAIIWLFVFNNMFIDNNMVSSIPNYY